MECLIEKLKVSVSDTTLPILEELNAFTLAAIELSGNSSMTDEQKWALNHYFYQIGAIENNALWQKLISVTLPVICGDNVSTACNDYKNDNIAAAPETATFVSHGLVCGSNVIGNYSGPNYGLCALNVFTIETAMLSSSNNNLNGVYETDHPSYVRYIFKNGSDTKNVISFQGINYDAINRNEALGAIGVVSDNAGVVFKHMSSGIITTSVKKSTGRAESHTYVEKSIYVSGTQYCPTGVAILAFGVTNEEMDYLISCSEALKNAFVG